jgi:ligand-binding SRPBCC domain-containing protein
VAFYQLYRRQYLPVTIEKLWDFISSPANLKQITPPDMGFDITTPVVPDKMYAGMIISYTVRPFAGLKTTWVTEITHVDEMKYFVDEQRIGPYALWHHQHILEPYDGGVMMTDIVTYRPPFGILGRIANTIFIRDRLEHIFAYREKAMERWVIRVTQQ